METATDRQQRISWWRQDFLEQARIAVIGAGALGNEVLKNLALLGVGRLSVFDFDTIEVSNLSRTVLFGTAALGQPKATVAAHRAKELNVNTSAMVSGHNIDVVWDLGAGYLRRMSIVLGCLDNLEARLAIGRHCYQLAVPFIDGGIRELGGRIQLHHTGRGACMDCTIGSGERQALEQRYSCLKVMKSYVKEKIVPTVQVSSALVAALVSQEAIKFVQGKQVPFGSVISWFGETNDFDVLQLIRDPACLTCEFLPIRPLNELPITCDSSPRDLFAVTGAEWSFVLPSPFIRTFTCGLCSRNQKIWKPSHRCKDVEFSCTYCNSAEVIAVDKVESLNMCSDPDLLQLTLRQLGFPPLHVFQGIKGTQIELFELTGDVHQFPELI